MARKRIIYQVLPRLWGNGRFSSWNDASFAYLHSLGVDIVWYTGIPRHASGEAFVKGDPGSPYAVCDWFDVNPYLADRTENRLEEFKAMVGRTHAAGLKCITDYIPNHVARNYKGPVALYPWCDGDWTDTLKVDWSRPETESSMLEVLRFWAGLGVDGFRCDMVELVPSDALGRLIRTVKSEHPGLLFVAEVYDRNNYRRYLEEAGFDLLYDKSGCYDILRGIMGGSRSARELSWNWQFLGDMQPGMLNFLENHDEQRIASAEFAADADAAWAALAYASLFNDASFLVYAGQELGEDASESDNGRTSIFNWSHPASMGSLWDFISGNGRLGEKESAVLSGYRSLLAMAGSELFREGRVWDLCYCNENSPGFIPDAHTAFVRYDGTAATLVFCNLGREAASVVLSVPEELRESGRLEATEVPVYAPACCYAAYKLKIKL